MSKYYFYFLVFIGFIFILLVTLLPFMPTRIWWDSFFRKDSLVTVSVPTIAPSPTPNIPPSPTLAPDYACSAYTLYNTDSKETVFSKVAERLILNDGDKIYFGSESNTQITEFDKNTGVSTLLYHIPDEELSTYQGLYGRSMKKYGNFLYVGFGGYMQKSKVIKIDVATKEVTDVIRDIHNPRIETIDNATYIVGGEGDACWGMSEYSVFNPNTGIAGPIFLELTHGCGNGDDLIGKYGGKWLLSNHSIDDTSDTPYPFPETIYHNILSIDLQEPYTRTKLLDESKMPQNVHAIYQDDETLYLVTKVATKNSDKEYDYNSQLQVYSFYPKDNSLSAGPSTTQKGVCTTSQVKNKTLCISCDIGVGTPETEVRMDLLSGNISSREVPNGESTCTEFAPDVSQYNKIPYTDFKTSLALPKNLDLQCVDPYNQSN